MPRGVPAPPGLYLVYGWILTHSDDICQRMYAKKMSPTIRTEDLIDAQGIADLLGLAQRNTISLYQKRYPEMPRPVIDLGSGRCRLWCRKEIVKWARTHSKRVPGRRPNR